MRFLSRFRIVVVPPSFPAVAAAINASRLRPGRVLPPLALPRAEAENCVPVPPRSEALPKRSRE